MSACMPSLRLSLHTHILGANRGTALDKRRSAPSSDMLKSHRMGFSTCVEACTFVHHWPVSFGLPLVSRRSATLSSASHTVHQQQPNILMCRDDAVRAAMLPLSSLSLPLSLFPSLLCSTAHLCHCDLLCFCLHPHSMLTVSTLSPALHLLSLFFSPSLPSQRLVSLKPLPAGALELDWGEASLLSFREIDYY